MQLLFTAEIVFLLLSTIAIAVPLHSFILLSGEILAPILIAIVCICIASLAFCRTLAPHCRILCFTFLQRRQTFLSGGHIGPSHYVIGLIELRFFSECTHHKHNLSLSFAVVPCLSLSTNYRPSTLYDSLALMYYSELNTTDLLFHSEVPCELQM